MKNFKDLREIYNNLATLICNFFFVMLSACKRILGVGQFFQLRGTCSVTDPSRRRFRSKMDLNLKCRENPIVIKVDSPEFKSIFTEEVIDLKKIFDKYKHEIRIAGGAVRDLLMGLTPKDLDFATTATPEEMKEMFTAEEVRMINVNGERHGTITARINDKENFEVTTLRIDMVTDGRFADVQFTKDWKLDANRRDLTINSMFLGFDGSVYDYFYGYEDLQKRRVAFVGDPDVRVKEDYLRIMRYFRFYGRIALKPDNHEEETLRVLKNNVHGLENISGERIWGELKKILQGNFAGNLLKTMLNVGVGEYMGFPLSPNVQELDMLLKRAHHLNLSPLSYLAALVKDLDEVTVLHSRMKFSKLERDLLYFLVEHRDDKVSDRPMKPYESLILNTSMKQKVAIEYVREVLKYRGDEELLKRLDNWEIPRFPVSGKTLKECGVPVGKMYGRIINKLRDAWIDSEYKMTEKDLMSYLPNIIEEFEEKKIERNK
ncbi:CCA tRNA nucleotidyltransferase 1, mitochondrial isoform X1 [Bombyx mori]|uniref:CCA tRNA nucleotidyltransferase 1, mitochondrial n=1 Tax=Bombyx mori TaxID=7091 RepID=A0A8R2MA42_BOMMO|nr:CCA tRNA nucleotidyltransferase 1, mitochondrial isoform X1 [Bombyx mori]